MEFAHVAASLAAAFFFALGIVLTQFGLRHAPPLAGASISVPTSCLLFLLVSPWAIDWGGFDAHALTLFALAGCVYPAAVTLLNFISNQRLGPNLAGALGNTTPLFAVGIAAVILGDRPHAWQWLGIVAVVGGLILIAAERVRSHPGRALWFLALPILAAAFRGAAQPTVKAGLEIWPDAVAASTAAYVVSTVLLRGTRLAIGPRRLPWNRGLLWYSAIGVANGLALLTLYTALTFGPVSTVAPLVATYPLIVLALNRAIHGDRTLTGITFGGIALSVAGVALVLAV